jgi:hypothetical protein
MAGRDRSRDVAAVAVQPRPLARRPQVETEVERQMTQAGMKSTTMRATGESTMRAIEVAGERTKGKKGLVPSIAAVGHRKRGP